MGRYFARVALVLLFVTGTSQAGVYPVFVYPSMIPRPRIHDISNVHKVAIVSGIGSWLYVDAQMSGGDSTRKVDISAWSIDDLVSALLRSDLEQRFQIVDVPYDRRVVNALGDGDDGSNRGAGGLIGGLAVLAAGGTEGERALKNILRGLPHDGIDAFVVVWPTRWNSAPGLSGLSLSGGSEWANFKIEILDARTFEFIGVADSRLQPLGDRIHFPGRDALTAAMAFDPVRGNDALKSQAQADFKALAAETVVDTLRALKLSLRTTDVDTPAPASSPPAGTNLPTSPAH